MGFQDHCLAASCVNPSASAFVFGFSMVRAISRSVFAAPVAQMAGLLAEVVMFGTVAVGTDMLPAVCRQCVVISSAP